MLNYRPNHHAGRRVAKHEAKYAFQRYLRVVSSRRQFFPARKIGKQSEADAAPKEAPNIANFIANFMFDDACARLMGQGFRQPAGSLPTGRGAFRKCW
ncbi:hypothetical protein D0B32_30495 [Paraburkholderia sp. DHOC27]|nr:hypothetical protein D0B32_30495 [Paraburkholderia sp. DHOC27]